MRQGVLDQVSQRLLDPGGVREDRDRASVERRSPPSVEAARPRTDRRSPGAVARRRQARGSDGKAALIGVGDQQQILGERGQALRLLGRRAERRLELGPASRTPQRQLELGPEQRERGPELVARVGDETPFVLDRRLEPAEHRVQRLGEAADLVPARGHREPAARASRPTRLLPCAASTRRAAAPQPASAYPASEASSNATGPATASSNEQAVERVFARTQRTRLDEDELVGPCGSRGARARATSDLRPAQAGCRQDAALSAGTRRSDRRPTSGGSPDGVERTTRPCASNSCPSVSPRALSGSTSEKSSSWLRSARARCVCRLRRAGAKALVDRREQRAADAEVDEEADRGENHRHRPRANATVSRRRSDSRLIRRPRATGSRRLAPSRAHDVRTACRSSRAGNRT